MQTAPWLGLIPGAEGQIVNAQEGESPLVNLLKSATSAVVSSPGCLNPAAFYTMSKQAEAAGLIRSLCSYSFIQSSVSFVYSFLIVTIAYYMCRSFVQGKHERWKRS